ncbi:MAG: hypothetical protein R3E79_55155 [Caldilineaceae bacterium]
MHPGQQVDENKGRQNRPHCGQRDGQVDLGQHPQAHHHRCQLADGVDGPN